MTDEFGYAYSSPGVNVVFKCRQVFSHVRDLFSEFSRYIAPAYYHDRCERSVQMRLYSMRKREFVVLFLLTCAVMSLMLFIGFAGPPIGTRNEEKASELSSPVKAKGLSTGPFTLVTPALSTYSRQLWLIVKIIVNVKKDQSFKKDFYEDMSINGITKDNELVSISNLKNEHNRSRTLECDQVTGCKDINLLHLSYLKYSYYSINVSFYGLEDIQQWYNIQDVVFYYKSYNASFTKIEIWMRFLLLVATFSAVCWFGLSLRKYPVYDWSLEQKWTAFLLILLLFFNNPLFPLTFLANSSFPAMFDVIFQVTFVCSVLLFWLCIFHGLRQSFRICFFIAGMLFLLVLIYLIITAYSELRSMPYFDVRLKFATLLMTGLLSLTCALLGLHYGIGIMTDNNLSHLSISYESSADFTMFYGSLNLYIFLMAYAYAPSNKTGHENHVLKDNPAFSMINDSDEEIIYGSDEDTRRPLNKGSNENDESD